MVCKFSSQEGLSDPVTAMIRNVNNNNVYYSSWFNKPGARCVSFEIQDIVKVLDIGLTRDFSAIFYKLAGRNPKKIDFTPHLKIINKNE